MQGYYTEPTHDNNLGGLLILGAAAAIGSAVTWIICKLTGKNPGSKQKKETYSYTMYE